MYSISMFDIFINHYPVNRQQKVD